MRTDFNFKTTPLSIVTRVPIADIFQTKRRRKRELNSTYYDDDYDFWAGKYDEYSEQNDIISTKERIVFHKYGNKSENKPWKLQIVFLTKSTVTW